LEIRRGVIWRRVVNVPQTRVQHTDVSQGPIERSHGLSTLIVHTAGTEHAQVALPGLSREDALALRDQLLPRDGRDAV
ncbi:MAG TPA: PH domain-containing protein, partial [Vicinamibacterales bacterium]|nr:PH domain-containing protein [Vicinamibacterales bacterium]